MKLSKLTGGVRFRKWIEKGDLPSRGGILLTSTIKCTIKTESQEQSIQESAKATIGTSHKL